MPPTSSDRAVPAESGDAASREALSRRIVAEYDEMPALCLTAAQAERPFGLREDMRLRVSMHSWTPRFFDATSEGSVGGTVAGRRSRHHADGFMDALTQAQVVAARNTRDSGKEGVGR